MSPLTLHCTWVVVDVDVSLCPGLATHQAGVGGGAGEAGDQVTSGVCLGQVTRLTPTLAPGTRGVRDRPAVRATPHHPGFAAL